jgi:uncharacterized membrane protein
MQQAVDSASLQADLRALGRTSASRAADSALTARRIVYAGVALYICLFIAAASVGYFTYDVARLDLGNMVQAIWNTRHGHFLESTTMSGRQASRLGSHVDPLLALLVPLWWVWPSPLMLVVLQVVAVASGALPVFWLARKHLRSDRAAAHFAFVYLLFPATQFNAIGIADSFHAVSLAIPLVLFAIWFLDEDRLVLFSVFALLAAATKEEIAASLACLGLWYAVRHKRRLAGLSIFAAGMAFSLANFLLVIPHFAQTGVSPFAGRYDAVGGTPTGIAREALTNPLALVHAVGTWHKLLYLALLLVPFLGLWLLEPLLFLGALPELTINMLSAKPEQTTIFWHYTSGIIPFLVAASIVGASKLKRDPDSTTHWLFVAIACIALLSPVYRIAVTDLAQARPSDPTRLAKREALALIPTSAPVSASNQLAGMLSARRFIYVFPVNRGARWAIVDANDETYGAQREYRRSIRKMAGDPTWRTVFRSHGVRVLHKR